MQYTRITSRKGLRADLNSRFKAWPFQVASWPA